MPVCTWLFDSASYARELLQRTFNTATITIAVRITSWRCNCHQRHSYERIDKYRGGGKNGENPEASAVSKADQLPKAPHHVISFLYERIYPSRLIRR